ncbi:MAG: leucine-rich repeat domain-containing protein, partial [Planctomycetes bacterium]|nr:leucine-rich repeat domain-containing protein [Planctomycetota bacterium]
LSELVKLASLDLGKNAIEDIKPLSSLKWLNSLNLKANAITDVSPLTPMTELRYTQLQGNKIADIAPLVEMAKKDAEGPKRFAPYWHLYLAGNPLNEAAAKHIEELKKIGVRVDTERK